MVFINKIINNNKKMESNSSSEEEEEQEPFLPIVCVESDCPSLVDMTISGLNLLSTDDSSDGIVVQQNKKKTSPEAELIRRKILEEKQKWRECRVILLGDSGVGKTSLLKAFSNPRFTFEDIDSPKATIGMDIVYYRARFDDGDSLSIRMYDAAGSERFRSIQPCLLRDVDVVVYVFDIENKQSLDNISLYWDRLVRESIYGELPYMILVGNKVDLISDGHDDYIKRRKTSAKTKITVSPAQARRVKYDLCLDAFWDTSAKTKYHLENVMRTVAVLAKKHRDLEYRLGVSAAYGDSAKLWYPYNQNKEIAGDDIRLTYDNKYNAYRISQDGGDRNPAKVVYGSKYVFSLGYCTSTEKIKKEGCSCNI